MSQASPRRAADFISSIGVNTHVNYTDSRYADAKRVLSELNYIGLNHVRDAAINPANAGQSNYAFLADNGIRFDFIVGRGVDPLDATQRIGGFISAHPGSVSAIEGPNEINNWPVTYHGLSGGAAGVAFQNDMFDAIRANTALGRVSVFSFTGANLASEADFANIHSYAKHGMSPRAWLMKDIAFQTSAVGHAMVLTEGGYSTLAGSTDGVDAATQAKLTLDLVFDAADLGLQQTYLYELLDAYPDPDGSKASKHLGLFDITGAPKPAALALHNLTQILGDHGAHAGDFAVTDMGYSLSGQGAMGGDLLLQKSSGVHDLVVWDEPDMWNETTHQAIAVDPHTVSVHLDHVYATVSIYDPLLGTDPIKVLNGVQGVSFDVSDHPVILEISDAPPPDALGAFSLDHVTHGTAEADILRGGAERDGLSGLDGADRLNGGKGDDVLIGGLGADRMAGGDGADRFVFTNVKDSAPGAIDVIADFDGRYDTIDLSAIDAKPSTAADDAFAWTAAFTHQEGQATLVYNAVHAFSTVSLDTNGDGMADFALRLLGHVTIDAGWVL